MSWTDLLLRAQAKADAKAAAAVAAAAQAEQESADRAAATALAAKARADAALAAFHTRVHAQFVAQQRAHAAKASAQPTRQSLHYRTR